jgi:uncharacterized membrane protein YfcA
MQFASDLNGLLPYVAGLLVAGVVAGFLAGTFGIGGGAVLVPVFYQVLTALGFDETIRMHVAVGTSLAIILPTSLISWWKHRARGAVDSDLLASFLIPVPAGVICATLLTALISGAGLRGIFAAVAAVVAARLLFAREGWRLGADIPKGMFRAAIGWLIGFLSTFMGIGGGVMNNTFMTLYGRPMHQAVATSSGVGVLIAIPGATGYAIAGWDASGLPPASAGFVNLLAVALIIPVTMLAAPFGVRLAHALSKRALEIGFGLFLAFVSIRFLASIL